VNRLKTLESGEKRDGVDKHTELATKEVQCSRACNKT